jgi:hypothetical protein
LGCVLICVEGKTEGKYENMKERDHWEYVGVVEIMLLKLNFIKKNSSTWA